MIEDRRDARPERDTRVAMRAMKTAALAISIICLFGITAQADGLSRIYGDWALAPNSDLCPPRLEHWIYAPTTISLSPGKSSLGQPLQAQYRLEGYRLTVIMSSPPTSITIPYRVIDDNTLEDLRPGKHSFLRRCQSVGSSSLLKCETEYLGQDLIMLSQYFPNDTLPSDLEIVQNKIVKTVEAGNLNTGCNMLRDLKQEIARRSK